MMQVLEQAIAKVGNLDQGKLAEYIHKNEFDTFVGKVRFAPNGEWAQSRVMMTQYHGIAGNDVDQFKYPGKVTVLYPKEYRNGDVKAPYHENKK
jgi:branched-chain amino acid transport system substrate-binding protein